MNRISLSGYSGVLISTITIILFFLYNLKLIQAGSMIDRISYIYIMISYLVLLGFFVIDVVLVIHSIFIKKQPTKKYIYGACLNALLFISLGLYFLSMQTA